MRDERSASSCQVAVDDDEAGCVWLNKVVQRGLLGAVALAVDRGYIGRPLGLPADGLHEVLPSAEPARSQAARYALSTLCIGAGQGTALVVERVCSTAWDAKPAAALGA